MPENNTDEEYYNSLPKKHIGTAVLIFNKSHQLLILNPSYKEGWSLPGGSADINESPMAAALRETKEEINFDLKDISLVCVEYTLEKGIKPETLQLIFFGGELNDSEISNISLDNSEHSEFLFVDISEAINLLGERQKYALPFCIEAIKKKKTAYIQF